MQIETTYSPSNQLIEYYKTNIGAYLYVLGELENRFSNNTKWFTSIENNEIEACALLNTTRDKPLLIALNERNSVTPADLLDIITDELPDSFYAHLGRYIIEDNTDFIIEKNYGCYLSMLLNKPISSISNNNITRLGMDDLQSIENFFKISYPGNWFKREKLERGYYIGYFEKGQLIGVAGTNLISKKYSLALLGNISVHPDFKGRKIATILTEKLCYELLKQVAFIGLDVHTNNIAAIKAYKNVGFEVVNKYEYCEVQRTQM